MRVVAAGLAIGAAGMGISMALAGSGVDAHFTHFILGQMTAGCGALAGWWLAR